MSAKQMLLDMGFPESKANKALAKNNNNLEQAMEWCLANPGDVEEEAETDAGDAAATSNEDSAKSFKCDDCGKLFRTSEEVEFHAVKSGHANFSESTEEKPQLSEEEKKEKLKELEERLRLRRKEREANDEEEKRVREKERIKTGQKMGEIQRKLKEDEIKKMAAERRREKLEDKLARQRVKEQIEKDREDRRQRLNPDAAGPAPTAPIVPAAVAAAPPAPKKEYDTARIQLRQPTGQPLIAEFKAREPLSAVRVYVTVNRTDGTPPTQNFSLSTTFPRKIFTEEDYEKPLDALGLVPSAVLVITNL